MRAPLPGSLYRLGKDRIDEKVAFQAKDHEQVIAGLKRAYAGLRFVIAWKAMQTLL